MPDEADPIITADQEGARSQIKEMAREISGDRADLLEDLFEIMLKSPDWVYWTTIREMFGTRKKIISSSDYVTKLGERLQDRLVQWNEEHRARLWDVKLERKEMESVLSAKKSYHLLLTVTKRADNVALTASPSALAPELKWTVLGRGEGYTKRMPLVIPFDSPVRREFTFTIDSEWESPPFFPDYLIRRGEKWKKEQSTVNELRDYSILQYRNHSRLDSHISNTLHIRIGGAVVRYSDFCVTNLQISEWEAGDEKENKRARSLKAKLGPTSSGGYFPPHAANPISVTVVLLTEDDKIIVGSNYRNASESPAQGLISVAQDIQRTPPFGICPKETVIRTTYKNLGISVHSCQLRWNAIALHRDWGTVSLLGEMKLGISQKDIESDLEKWVGNGSITKPTFVKFNPQRVSKFLGSKDAVSHFFEAAVAFSLRNRFPKKINLKVAENL